MSENKGWNRLRGKLASLKEATKVKDEDHDSDVADFLRPNLGSSADRIHLAPKLDIAAAQQQTNRPNPTNYLSEIGDTAALRNMNENIGATIPVDDGKKWIPNKPTRQVGLQVKFENGQPVIIGNGGDETEEATIFISNTKARNASATSSAAIIRPSAGPERVDLQTARSVPQNIPSLGPRGPEQTELRQSSLYSKSAPIYGEPSSFDIPPVRLPLSIQSSIPQPQLKEHVRPPEVFLRKPTGSSSNHTEHIKAANGQWLKTELSQQDLREMRASEGQTFRSSVRASTGISVALDSLQPSAASNQFNLVQNRPSLESNRSISGHSQDSQSPETSPLNELQRTYPTNPSQSIPLRTNFLTPLSSAHDQSAGNDPQNTLVPGSSGTDSAQDLRQSRASQDLKSVRRKPSPQEAMGREARVFEDVKDLDTISQDFLDRLQSMDHIFQLALPHMSEDYSASDWLRSAIWWFSKGRNGFELIVRSRILESERRDPGIEIEVQMSLRQNHLDLAKAWWIVQDILPGQISHQNRDESMDYIIHACTCVREAIKRLCVSLSKRNVQPPASESGSGLDTTLWLDYPSMPPKTYLVLTNGMSGLEDSDLQMSDCITNLSFDDNSTEFYCGTAFGNAVVAVEDDQVHERSFPCAISLLRRKGSLEVEGTIVTQSPMVQVAIRNGQNLGLRWEHVKWERDQCSIRIKLPYKHRLWLYMDRSSFNLVWGVFDQLNTTFTSFSAHRNEYSLYRFEFPRFEFVDTTRPGFPQERLELCRATIFERFVEASNNSNGRKIHGGYRLAIITDPYQKTIFNLSLDLSLRVPIEYTYDTSDSNSMPTMRMHLIEVGRRRSLAITFEVSSQRDMFRDFISGSMLSSSEKMFVRLPLYSLAIRLLGSPLSTTVTIRSASVQVINAKQPDQGEESDQLRVFSFNDAISLVDRLNVNPGELQIRLDQAELSTISFLRQPRRDLTIAIGPEPAGPDIRLLMHRSHDLTTSSRTVVSYKFQTLREMHDFQTAITRCDVTYDGKASKFGISRRRMVVPIYRNFEADGVRIQIIERGAVFQLLAFFDNYELADCLNFQIKNTDVFEHFEKGGEYCVRLVDAKFALPLVEQSEEHDNRPKQRNPGAQFTCIDYLDYASEHEDIIVSFNTMTGTCSNGSCLILLY